MLAERIPAKKKNLQLLLQSFCFALCFFAFQLTEFTVNDRAAALLGSDWITAVYSGGLCCTGLGFASLSLLRRVLHGELGRKVSVCAIGALAVAATVCLLATDAVPVFFISAALLLLTLGVIGGCVYYNCAMTFLGSRSMGRVLGIGMSCAVLLQFVVQNLLATRVAFVVSIGVSVLLLVYFVVKPQRDWMFENPLPYSTEPKTNRAAVGALLAAVCLMSVVCALLDGVVLSAHAAGQASVSGFVRLFYAASLLAAGFAADLKNGKYLSLLTVCLMFLSTVSAVFFKSAATYLVGIIFIYVFSGFYVMFLTVRFLTLAPKTADPTLWAGMGRSVRSLTIAAAAVPTALVFERYGSTALVIASCVLSVVIMLILLKDIGLSLLPQEKPQQSAAPVVLSKAERIQRYAARYELTPRETEVLVKLLTDTDDGVQALADSLFLSRRVLQRYISAIYEKTETHTRIGLFQSFTEFHDE